LSKSSEWGKTGKAGKGYEKRIRVYGKGQLKGKKKRKFFEVIREPLSEAEARIWSKSREKRRNRTKRERP